MDFSATAVTRRPSISYLQEHGLDLSISCQIKAISEWKLDLMAAKVFEHLTFDKGKTVKEVYKILSRCMAEEKTVRISRKAMLEKASLSRESGWTSILTCVQTASSPNRNLWNVAKA